MKKDRQKTILGTQLLKKMILCALCVVQTAIGQEQMASFATIYEGKSQKITSSFHLANPEKDELVLFLGHKNKITAHRLDKDFGQIDQIATKELPALYRYPVGGIVLEDSYTLFLGDEKNLYFAALSVDFKSKQVKSSKLNINFFKEKFLQSVNIDNQLYLISISKKSSDLNFYQLNHNGGVNKKTISLADSDFKINGKPFVKNLYDHLAKGSDGTGPFSKAIEVVKIEEKDPNPIGITRKHNKMYLRDDTLILTADIDNQRTVAIEINLDTWETKTRSFSKKMEIHPANLYSKTNSFLFEDKLYQITSSKDTLIFNIKNYHNKEEIKTFSVGKSDTIPFKNTAIQQQKEGGMASSKIRELNKTSKFLRKISLQKNAISVYREDTNMVVTLGGEQETQGGSAGMMAMGAMGGMMGGIAIASFGNVSLYYNPTVYAYGANQMVKTIWIDCLFDKDYNHLEGEVKNTYFDQIDNFTKAIKDGDLIVNETPETKEYGFINTLSGKNIFWHKDEVYFGFYQKRDKTYNIFRFDH